MYLCFYDVKGFDKAGGINKSDDMTEKKIKFKLLFVGAVKLSVRALKLVWYEMEILFSAKKMTTNGVTIMLYFYTNIQELVFHFHCSDILLSIYPFFYHFF